jgi:hypothetical protein
MLSGVPRWFRAVGCCFAVLACAQGYPAAGSDDETGGAGPVPVSRPNNGPFAGSPAPAGVDAAGASGASGGASVAPSIPAAGSGLSASCQNLACDTVIDCVIRHFGNNCGFRSCDAGFCR